jgi:hypothetical protein
VRAPRAALLPLLLILACSCGLPGNYYLEPPSAPGLATPTGGESFRVTTTDRSADIAATFLGYDYYYKCFGADDAALAADTVYGGEAYDYSILLSRGFLRLCRGPSNVSGISQDVSPGQSSPPLLNIRQIDMLNLPLDDSITGGYTISMWINDINQPSGLSRPTGTPASYLEYSPPTGLPLSRVGIEVRRYVAYSGSECKTFDSNTIVLDNWLSLGADADLSAAAYSLVQASADKYLYIVVYAVSYGRGDDGSTVRSHPVYLGYTRTVILPP